MVWAMKTLLLLKHGYKIMKEDIEELQRKMRALEWLVAVIAIVAIVALSGMVLLMEHYKIPE